MREGGGGGVSSPAEPVGASWLILTCQSKEHGDGRNFNFQTKERKEQQWHLGKTFVKIRFDSIVNVLKYF